MKIGVLGSGDVAKVLASGFIKHGHDTMVGTRDSAKLAKWASENRAGKVGSFSETAAFGEIVVLAVKGSAAADALRAAGAANLAGKTVIDATNPIAEAPPVNGVLKFFTNLDESLMERLQSEFAQAQLRQGVQFGRQRAHGQPAVRGRQADDVHLRQRRSGEEDRSARMLDQFGWETADMGKAEAARAIEPLCMLWCIPGFLRNDWAHAFKLLR